MPEYCYRTESSKCEGTTEKFHECTGKFTLVKKMADASRPERCKICSAQLKKDLQAQGAPADSYKGSGFHKTDY
jgi:predicted nucleic acid-binding Zn ribbon protein